MTKPATQATGPVVKKDNSAPVFIENISINSSRKETVVKKPVDTSNVAADNIDIPELTPDALHKLQFKYAILLDVTVEEMIDEKMLGFLESWYGTRYKMGGVDKRGVDCSAFVQSFMMAIYGLMMPRTSAEQFAQSDKIKKSELREGDLVFFRTQRKKAVSHVGVYLRNNKFVHASTSSGVMISDLSEDYFSSRYAGAGRYRSDNDENGSH